MGDSVDVGRTNQLTERLSEPNPQYFTPIPKDLGPELKLASVKIDLCLAMLNHIMKPTEVGLALIEATRALVDAHEKEAADMFCGICGLPGVHENPIDPERSRQAQGPKPWCEKHRRHYKDPDRLWSSKQCPYCDGKIPHSGHIAFCVLCGRGLKADSLIADRGRVGTPSQSRKRRRDLISKHQEERRAHDN